jgi:uncharacterized protein (DUF302 family)
MKYEIVSKDDLLTTVDKVKVALKENGFGTLYELNFKDKFLEHGLDYPNDFFVLEVCNPSYARKILEISKDVGYFLPCKVVVYEDDGVKIGMIKPSEMLHMITDKSEAVDIAKEVESILMKSMNY